MAGNRSDIVIALAGLAILPGAAWAAGQITGVVANPSSTYVNQPVNVTVQGTGTCSQVVVRCQAPAAPEHVKTNVALPFTVSCTYPTLGTKTVTASAELPNADCPGDKIAQVTVKSQFALDADYAELLCKLAGCDDIAINPDVANFAFAPKIDKVFGILSPGGPVLVGGVNFGPAPGKLQLISPHLGAVNLGQLEWSKTGIGGTIPGGLCNVPDHAAQLRVTAQNGAKSNDWPVNFSPGKEYRWLTTQDVQLVSCGQDGNVDRCNGSHSIDYQCPAGDSQQDYVLEDHLWASSGPIAIRGFHYNCWGATSSDSGTDKYQVRALKNGWRLSHAEVWKHASEGSISGPSPALPYGEASWAPSFDWTTTADDYVYYDVGIEIEGPCGVPHK